MLEIKDDIIKQFNSNNRKLIEEHHMQEMEQLLVDIFKHRTGEKYNGKYIEPAAKQISKHICGDFSTGLLFHGCPGSGKTIMMEILIGILNKVAGKRFKLHNSHSIYECLTGQIELGTPIKESTYTFIDDFGEEPLQHYNEYPMVSFILNKYREEKLIFCTTNMNSKMIEEHYGGRISSRVMEMFTPVSFGDIDFRKVNKKR